MSKAKTLINTSLGCIRSVVLGGAAGALLSLSLPVSAEELRTPLSQKPVAASEQMIDVPRNGLSKAAVKRHFGAPQSMQGPVGDPPISQWRYGEFTVYFEYDKVIHTVVEPQGQR